MTALSDALAAFDADPAAAGALVRALRATPLLRVAYTADGRVATVRRGASAFLAVGEVEAQVAGLGAARPVPGPLVWAMVAAGRADGAVVDPAGPTPAWIDADGAARIGGPVGLRLVPGAAVRSVAEAHAVLDLLGWPPGVRGHTLIADGGALLAEYRWEGAPPEVDATVRLAVPDAGEPDAFGVGASTVIDPAGWRWLAEREVARASRAGASGEREAARYAARCVHEALAFADEGEEIPAEAFFSRTGRLVRELAPERFERARLVALAAAWDRFADGGATP